MYETNRHLSIRCERLVLCETLLNLNKILQNDVGSVGRERLKEGDRPFETKSAMPVACETGVKGDRPARY